MDPCSFLQWLFQRFVWGQACPHSSHLGRCLPPKPALERITNPSSLAPLQGFFLAMAYEDCGCPMAHTLSLLPDPLP